MDLVGRQALLINRSRHGPGTCRSRPRPWRRRRAEGVDLEGLDAVSSRHQSMLVLAAALTIRSARRRRRRRRRKPRRGCRLRATRRTRLGTRNAPVEVPELAAAEDEDAGGFIRLFQRVLIVGVVIGLEAPFLTRVTIPGCRGTRGRSRGCRARTDGRRPAELRRNLGVVDGVAAVRGRGGRARRI